MLPLATCAAKTAISLNQTMTGFTLVVVHIHAKKIPPRRDLKKSMQFEKLR
jgi:hypothetical protein